MERRQYAVVCAENLIRIEWPELHLVTSRRTRSPSVTH